MRYLALLPATLSLAAAQLSAQNRQPKSGQVNGYVDSKICATCHREIAANYARTGMGRSFFRPAAVNEIEDYAGTPEYYHALSDSHYSMTVRNGQYFQKRWQIGLDGKEINVEETKIDYVIGSGNHGRFYLHRTERGMLIELPLGWYPEKGGGWGLTPGSDFPQPRTRRFIAYRCMFCHNAYPNVPAANQAPGGDPVFTGDLPEGIDCQRCHGPGGEHVRTSGRTGIVNPAKLDAARRIEVCLQCHLETTGGKIPTVVQAFDRGTFTYIPGQPLMNYAIFFDYAPGSGRENRFEGVSGAYRFLKSRCYNESGGKLECITCHDPHDIPRGEDATRHYSSICLSCHKSVVHPAGIQVTNADCITCHMPKRRPDDGPHMIFTDHMIQKHAPANALAEFPERTPQEYRGPVVPFYPQPLPKTAETALYTAVAQVGLENNVVAGMPDLVRLLDEVKPREPEFYMVLGDGWKALGKPREAAAAYEHALQLNPSLTAAMRALATVQPDRAERILARAVQVAPNDPESWFRYGVLTSSAERIQKAIDLDPWLPDQSRALAEASHSVAALKDALRTDPFDDAAWDLGGRIMTERGDFREAFFDFERAVKIRPDASYLYDYALGLVRADRYDEAQLQAERAVGADAGNVEAHELLGGLHARKKELAEAAREYRLAIELKPELSRAHLRLAMVLAAGGDKTGAAEHLREAAKGNDAAVAKQATDALRGMGLR
ncbi:MAG TPA: tetratricopeptide repeat protein [Bryobacteraceae bacterium]|nr:tetratricopeptide repeat protein [Bryobacteraceae bacterium]